MTDDAWAGAMQRIKAVTRSRTQVELADIFGIRQSSISDAKRRRQVPPGWLVTLVQRYAASPAWILDGQGQPYLKEDDARRVEDAFLPPPPAAPLTPDQVKERLTVADLLELLGQQMPGAVIHIAQRLGAEAQAVSMTGLGQELPN